MLAGATPLAAQTSAFTYQGRLDDGGAPANGRYDFIVTDFDAATGGSSTTFNLVTNIGVTNGLFTLSLDLTALTFPGADRWLEISVRTNGTGGFTPLNPRQRVTSAPYAIRAASAGSVAASGITGTLAPAQLPANVVTNAATGVNLAGAFSGNGAGLTNLNAWQLGGNAGTTPGVHYLGTSDSQPLEVKVHNARALRLEPGLFGTVNVIGGWSGNDVTSPLGGGTIGGGGAGDWGGLAYTNRVTGWFGTVGGGLDNTAGGNWSTVDGGAHNTAGGLSATIGGGQFNLASGSYASIGGGHSNLAAGFHVTVAGGHANTADGTGAVVAGGRSNTASWDFAVVGGGLQNLADQQFATVGGGWSNRAGNSAATVAGGWFNVALGVNATAGGGLSNSASSYHATVAGGQANAASAAGAAVGGGKQNTASSDLATVGGGGGNLASGGGATIGGGVGNQASASLATIGGGEGNRATNFAATVAGGWNGTAGGDRAVVGGGGGNTASGPDSTVAGGAGNVAANEFATVAGGGLNEANGTYSTVGGGSLNKATGPAATIPGGTANTATNRAFAAGNRAKAIHTGTFVWADSQEADFASTGANQFLIRASGGVGINRTNPTAALHIGGTAGVDGIRFPDGTLQTTAATPAPAAPVVAFMSGPGSNPATTNHFVSATVSVTITSPGQKILVTSHKAFGSTVAGGAAGLNLFIGYQPTGGSIATVGEGVFGNQVPQNTRVTMGLSGVITGLAAGTYVVGLVGVASAPANWNSNEYSYTTAVVY